MLTGVPLVPCSLAGLFGPKLNCIESGSSWTASWISELGSHWSYFRVIESLCTKVCAHFCPVGFENVLIRYQTAREVRREVCDELFREKLSEARMWSVRTLVMYAIP
ncbi:hypothetical protein Tcan_18431 [Toxocara canis]|uniref:Uncharacterized protein n=1 Tax=Toxocara canis TaxID=6265 RepID=A0A0B2VIF3_TOXCA|nr:hypothetical protein Tcan_18431 [Toxocara canis]